MHERSQQSDGPCTLSCLHLLFIAVFLQEITGKNVLKYCSHPYHSVHINMIRTHIHTHTCCRSATNSASFWIRSSGGQATASGGSRRLAREGGDISCNCCCCCCCCRSLAPPLSISPADGCTSPLVHPPALLTPLKGPPACMPSHSPSSKRPLLLLPCPLFVLPPS